MEDASICHIMPTHVLSQHALFCVLDGHGGNLAAEFAKEEFLDLLNETPDFQRYCQIVSPFIASSKKKKSKAPSNKQIQEFALLLEKALTQSFVELDRALYLQNYCEEGKGKVRVTAGSTAVACLVTPFTVVCANLGDCRAILASSSTSSPTTITAKALSHDHLPDLETEKQRIVKAGGTVENGRVDGELAMSRALGDFELKDISLIMTKDDEYDGTNSEDLEQLLQFAQQQKVTPYPEIQVHHLNETDRFLILACDGLWDVTSNDEMAEWTTGLLQQQHGNDTDLGRVCEQLLDLCYGRDSQDNMTIVLVVLEGGNKLIGK